MPHTPSSEEGAEADASLPEPLSQGADLEQLLQDAQAIYAQSYYRHRSFYHAPENVPAVDVTAVEQVGGRTPARPALAQFAGPPPPRSRRVRAPTARRRACPTGCMRVAAWAAGADRH